MSQVKKSFKKKTASFGKKVAGSFGIKIGGMGITFLLQVYLARILGVEQYGFYVYVLTCLNLLLFVGLWGWSSSTVKFVSVYKKKAQWASLKGVLNASAWLPFCSSIFVSVGLVVVVFYMQDKLKLGLFDVFLIGSLLLPFNALLSTFSSATQGLKRPVLAQVPQAIYRPLLLMALVAGFQYQHTEKLMAVDVMSLNLMGVLVIVFIAWGLLRHSRPKQVNYISAEYHFVEWIRVALPLLLFSGFVLLMKQFDIIMLGIYVDPTEAGIYSVATRISELTTFSLMAVNVVVAPLIAEHYAEGKSVALQKVASMAATGVFIMALPVATITIIYGEEILNLFGAEFQAGYMSLVVLVGGQVINGLAGSVGFFMTMTGHQKQAVIIMGAGAILNILVNVLLIPRYGMLGAAYATAASMIFWNICMLIKVQKMVGINSTVFSLLRN